MLVKDGYIRNLRRGDLFALEGCTKVEDRLLILMSGRLSVKADNVLLHTVSPYEFVNSVEWEATKLQTRDQTYRVLGRLLNNGPVYQVNSGLQT